MTPVPSQRSMMQSAAMQELAANLQQAIRSGGSVLLCGEPGSGRQMLARAIHLSTHGYDYGSVEHLLRTSMNTSPNGQPFVVVDCSDSDGLETRLFGVTSSLDTPTLHDLEKLGEGSALHGAFGGTLFLRHVPELPARLQHRLARVLRDGEVWLERPAGEAGVEPVVVRTIATSRGREDDERIVVELRKRLEHTRLEMPPLRNRREDIPGLVRYLLVDICAELSLRPKHASNQAVELLAALPWRGNVDELRSFLTMLLKKAPGRLIRQTDVLANVRLDGAPCTASYSGSLKQAREQFEKDYVAAVLQQHHGRMAEAAKELGIQRTNLYRKVRQLAVKRRQPGARP